MFVLQLKPSMKQIVKELSIHCENDGCCLTIIRNCIRHEIHVFILLEKDNFERNRHIKYILN